MLATIEWLSWGIGLALGLTLGGIVGIWVGWLAAGGEFPALEKKR